MKIVKLLISILLIQLCGYGQENKGRVMLNGSGNYYKRKNDQSQKFNISNPFSSEYHQQAGFINLNVGYFFSNHFAMGITGLFGKQKSNQTTIMKYGEVAFQKYLNSRFSTGIFARYNQPLGKSKFGIFLQWSHNYYLLKAKEDYRLIRFNSLEVKNERHIREHGYNSSFVPGLFYFISDRFSLETSLGSLFYEYRIIEDQIQNTNTGKVQRFSSNFSISTLSLGLTFYLGKSKSGPTEATTGSGEQ
jgi:hypothetical protein